MTLSRNEIAAARAVYETYWDSYLTGNIEAFVATIDETFSIIGTSEGEKSFGKEAVAAMYQAQFDEIVGKAQVRNRQVREIPTGDMLQIIEFSDIYVLIDSDWKFYSKFRLSTLLHQTPNGWKLLQQHGSLPDMRVGEGETVAVEKISKENLELRDAVKRRTIELENKSRELEIEAALERVRSRSMAMQNSDELKAVIKVVYEQLSNLNINLDHAGFVVDYSPHDDWHFWIADDREIPSKITHPYFESVWANQFDEAKKNGENLFVTRLNFEEKNKFYNELLSHVSGLTETSKEFYLSCPGLAATTVLFDDVSLYIENFSGIPYKEEENEIVLRFGKVFQQAYTRFLDLQKAEAQAREAKVETALEKVRSRTMAMQHSDELQEASYLLDQQVRSLGIQTWGCAFNIYGEEDSTEWFGNEAGVLHTYTVPRKGIFKEYYEKGQRGESIIINEFSGKACVDHYEYMSKLPVLGDVLKILKETNDGFPTYQIDHVVYFKYGYLLFITREDVPEAHGIFKRFAKVFEQTYTRFLDLQKAEAQAREAQIENALEKVRSRSLAMQKSDELLAVIIELSSQLQQLNVRFDFVSFGVIGPEKEIDFWMAGEGYTQPELYHMPYFDHFVTNSLLEDQKKGLRFSESTFNQKDTREWMGVLYENNPHSKMLADTQDHTLTGPGMVRASVILKNICVFMGNFRLKPHSKEQNALLIRFANAFDQAYTRFLDLQKAETQAREAKIETALEKVRSRTMGMQKSDELADVADVLFKEMNNLVHNLWTCGFVLCEKDREEDEWWLGLEEGFTRGFFLPNVNDYAHAHLYEGWLKKDDFRTVQLEGDDLQAHYEWLMEIPVAKNIFDEMEAAGMERPEWQKLHAAYFSKGYLVIITREPCPEEAIFKRFAQVFDLTYTRFLDLQKAEAQAREAQIENALEKVRSRSLAMQSPDELIEVAELLREEMGTLGVEELETSSIFILDDSSGKAQCWFTTKDADNPDKSVSDQITINLQDTWVGRQMNEFYGSGQDTTSILTKGDHRVEWFRYIEQNSDLLGKTEFFEGTIPERTVHLCKFPHGFLGAASPGNISDDSWDLIKRATRVFSFAYTRFLDLQKAEMQAREAKIELSLERIRAQVTSMQESSDLLDIVVAMRTEFVNLGHEAHYFWHMRWLPDTYAKAMTSGDGTKIGMVMTLPRHIHGDIPAVAHWEKSNEPTHVLAMDIETAVDYVDKMITLGDFERVDPQAPSLDDIRHIGGLTFVMARTTHGEIGFSLPGVVEDPPKDSVDTLMRFAGVFDLAYRRFEDLKKAEYQRRETEIELALERTRTQSMLMQHSDEIKNISEVFHQQLLTLNIPSEFSYVWLPDESQNNHQFWASWAEETEGGLNFSSKQVTYPLDKTEPYTAACYQAWSKPDRVHEEFIPPSDVYDFFDTWAELLEGAKNLKANNFKEGIYYSEAYMRYGCFGINIRRELSDEEKRVLKRFSTEFERAYTRFLDLQKAEAQTREAQIESALEKVRSRSLAMQKSDELLAVIIELSSQLQQLNVRFDFVSFGVIGPEKEIDFWMAGEGYTQPELYHMPYFDHFVTNSLLEDQKKGLRFSESTFNQKETREWMEVLYENNPKSKMLADTKDHALTGPGMVRASVILKNICVFMGNFRLKPHSKEQNALLIRFANAFEQAYTRFLDLQKAEAQAEQAEENLKTIKAARAKAEEALIELKAAQNQLIQAEKLASLGQLTAGIAHEIKNPLNFVNNFSELNVELIDEVFEELEKLEASESSELMAEILEDVKSNLTKIHEHGTRADGIVKSMLQHSRGSSGKIEPTNLNSLIKEYTNLAFHGMRAGKNPINVEIDLQLDSSITDIPLISEDFTRVILNLCNNAFDAMRETESQRSPKLTVRTQKTDKHISVEVGDNGSGIPDDIKEKILQPFFTTKKGTDGTGLGLSITNDIIKAHGGEITIDSSQGKGTTFSIHLPIKGQ